MYYRPEIDGLRAIAVLPVILYHAGYPTFSGGFVGVDVFFVISGFLITTIIKHEINERAFTLERFYERRARRILPALLTVTIACIPFAWLWMLPEQFHDFSQSILAVLVFSSNLLFWQETGYFEPSAELKPLLHTWSLSVEEQFYLCFPLLMLLIRGTRQVSQMALIGVLTFSSFGLSVYGSIAHPSATFYLIPTRAWEIGVGALLVMSTRQNESAKSASEFAAALGLGMIVAPIFVQEGGMPFSVLHTLVPVIGAALTIRFADRGTFVGRLLASPVLVGVGLISFSLYLWHQPLLAFARIRSLMEPSQTEIVAVIVMTFILSIATWKFVEQPFRSADRLPRKLFLQMVAIASCLLLGIGLIGHLGRGLPDATDARAHAQQIQHRLRINYGLDRACEEGDINSPQCRTSDSPEILVWGDSYAMHLVSGVREQSGGRGVVQATKTFCGPINGIAPVTPRYALTWAKSCNDFNHEVLAWLRTNHSVKVVIVSSPFSQYLAPESRVLVGARVAASSQVDVAEKFLSTLKSIRELGVEVIVVSPPPMTGTDFGQCLLKASYYGVDRRKCDFRRSDAQLHAGRTIELLRRIEGEFPVVWLEDVFCKGAVCAASIEHVLLYRDDGHLTHEGSVHVAAQFDFLSKK